MNQRRQPVTYRPFRADPLLSEGLLGVARPGGELERQVADAFFRVAGHQGRIADAAAERDGALAGELAALDGRPQRPTIEGGAVAGGGGGGAGAVTGPAKDQAKALLRKFEGFRETPYWDVNALRTGYGTDTVTRPDGRVERVTKATRVTREDAERDLDRRVGEFVSTATRQVGVDNWSRLPAGTQAALASVTYNYGSLPKTVVSAVKGGDLSAIARAVEGLSSNPGRRKQEAAHIRASASAGAAPAAPVAPGVAPSVQAPKIVPAGGDRFRPSGSDTIRGRAYDAAGTRTYLQALKSEILSTQQQVFEKFGEDPEALARGFADLKKLQLDDDVFPEIRAEYELAFDARADGYMTQARRDQEKRAEQANRQEFLTRTASLEDQRARDMAGLDPEIPATAEALHASQAALDDHYDAAVLHGILDPAAADTAKRRSRNETAIGFYAAQAEALDAEGVAELRETMRKDFAANKLDGVDADGWQKLDSKLESIERLKLTKDRQASADLEKRGGEFVKRAAAGWAIDQGELGRFILDANTAPDGPATVNRTLRILQTADMLRLMPVDAAEARVRDMRRKAGENPSADDIAVIEASEAMIAATRRSLATGLLDHAERMGVVEPSPGLSEAGTAADMAAIMAGRIDRAETAAAHFGVPPRYLKAGEAGAIEAMVKADPVAGAEVAGAIVAGAGPRAAAVLSEFGKDAPVIAGAGAIVAAGGSSIAAQDAIAGFGKAPDGRAWPAIPKETREGAAARHIGAALALQPSDAQRISQTGEAIAKKRIAEAGIDGKSDEAKAIVAQAFDEAAGAVFDGDRQFGGFATMGEGWFSDGWRVLVPNAIRTDRFGDVLSSIRDADLERVRVRPVRADGSPFPLSLLAQMRPVAVAGGYAFARNDPDGADPQFVMGRNGEPWVLDVEALIPRLAPRVPGAFRGY